jgi:hypothetical protein
MINEITLRKYQETAVEKVLAAIEKDRGTVMVRICQESGAYRQTEEITFGQRNLSGEIESWTIGDNY